VGRSLWREEGLSFAVAAGPRQRSHSQVLVPWDSRPYFTVSNSRLPFSCKQIQSRSHIATDSRSICKSWCRAPSGVHDQIFITLWHLRSCFSGAPSLTRGRVCLLYMLLSLSSVVFLWSESLRTRGHILLSQIWDFPFRRLLRLAGSRWRYSTPPPHGCSCKLSQPSP
jgi:hypothetical protein